MGFLISATARRIASAVGVAIFAWLVSVFLGDLGLIGTAVVLQLSPRSLLWLSLANPAQVFKLAVLQGIQRNLESLGPGGLYATEVLGDWLPLSAVGPPRPMGHRAVLRRGNHPAQTRCVMRPINVVAWLIAAGVLAGCQPTGANRPPTVRFGEEACAECRMIISDERFAAAVVTATGEAFKFDDIGCVIEHETDQIRPDVAYWVRDFRSREWLNAREATFVHSASIASPMGFGLAAMMAGEVSDGPAGRKLRFHELPGLLADRSREPGSDRPYADRTPPAER